MAKVQDEAGHGMYLYSAAETLGVSRSELTELLISANRSTRRSLTTDALVGGHGGDRMARRRCGDHEQIPLTRCSYVLCRAIVRICKEESSTSAKDSRSCSRYPMGRLRRRRWPRSRRPLVVAGGDDVRPPRDESLTPSSRWPGRSNESATTSCGRSSSTSRCPAEILVSKCRIPTFASTGTGHYVFGEIDWTEFWDVVKGNGPCNHERMEHRREPTRGPLGPRRGRGLRRKTDRVDRRAAVSA